MAKTRFVLDEGILITAQSGQDVGGNRDLSAMKLVVDILENCHKLHYDKTVLAKYEEKFSALSRSGTFIGGVNVVNLLREALFNQEKGVRIEHHTGIEPQLEGCIPRKDKAFVYTAITAAAVLATTDDRLIKALKDGGLIKRYNLKVMSAANAAKLAGPAD